MATDDIDPAQASRRAMEGLQHAVEDLNRHVEQMAIPTMEQALARAKANASSEGGLGELPVSALSKQFISQAWEPEPKQIPGMLSQFDSSPPESRKPIYDEGLPGSQGRRGPSVLPGGVSADASSPIPGLNWGQATNMNEEPMRIPVFGSWQLDALLKLGEQAAGKSAMGKYKQYASQASEAGETPTVEAFQATQGPLAAGNIAHVLNTASSMATYGSAIKAKILQPAFDFGIGASRLGTSLGYSPQAGTGINASHIAGLINPIALATSPAAKVGLGATTNALEQSLLGTGIGVEEAKNLSNALASQGWSNQREGGAFGFDVGGNQATLENTLAPLVKKGFNSPTSIEQLAESTNALKLGQANPEELKKVLEQLPEAAKTLHKTLEEVTSGMEEFAAKTAEGGGTLIAGMKHYGEIAQSTGMNPTIIQGINEGKFGKAQAITKGVMPWGVQSMSGSASAMNAMETVEKVAGFAKSMGPFTNTTRINKVTGKEEIVESAATKEASAIHMMEPNITAEHAERLKEIGKPRLEAQIGARQEAENIQKHRYEMERSKGMVDRPSEEKAGHEYYGALNQVKQLEEGLALTRKHGGYFEGKNSPQLEQELQHAKESLSNRHESLENTIKKAKKAGQLGEHDQNLLRAELEGSQGLYASAEKAGVSSAEVASIKKEGVTK